MPLNPIIKVQALDQVTKNDEQNSSNNLNKPNQVEMTSCVEAVELSTDNITGPVYRTGVSPTRKGREK